MTRLLAYAMRLSFSLLIIVSIQTKAWTDEFYKGKTIQFIIGSAPGGGFDMMTRVIARHFAKHIPGSPSTLVGYMPGAGNRILAKYMYKKAKPDGLTIGNFSGNMILGQVLGIKALDLDFRDFGWLGVPMQDHFVCALTKASGISSIDQLVKSKRPVKIGGSAPGNALYDFPQILKGILGLPIRVIGGYRGSARIKLAADSGEVGGGCWTWQVMRLQWRHELKAGDVRVVLQLAAKSSEDLKTVPLAIDLARTETDRKIIQVGIHDRSAITKVYSLPPNTPKSRLTLLKKAFIDTMKDPAFLRDTQRLNFDIKPFDSSETKRIVERSYDLDPMIVTKLKKVLLPKDQ